MSETISWWLLEGLLHFVWQGLLIGVLLAIVLQAMKRSSSSSRYAACSISLVAMAACVPITLSLLARDGRLAFNETSIAVNELLEPVPALPSRMEGEASPIGSPRFEDTGVVSPTTTSIPSVDQRADTVVADDVTDSAEYSEARAFFATLPWVNVLAILYMSGVVIMLSRVTFMAVGSKRLRHSSEAISDVRLLDVLDRLCRRVKLSARPQIAYCHNIVSPAVIGVLRPMILIPPAMLTGLSTSQCETLLLHELAHIRRHDVLFLSLQRLVESLLFFHPAVWYASRAMSVERENCCDDWVLRCGFDRVHYADALVRMAEFAIAKNQTPPPAILANALGKRNQLKDRILRLLTIETRRSSPVRHSKTTVCGLFVLTLAVTLTCVALIDGTIGQEAERTASRSLEEPTNEPSDGTASNDKTKTQEERQRPEYQMQVAGQFDLPVFQSAALIQSATDRQSLLKRYQESQFQPGVRVTLEPVFGTVRGFHAKPVAGAKVYLCERSRGIQSWGRNTPTAARKIAETETDANGKYSFQHIPSQPLTLLRKQVLPLDVIVVADGFAVRWQRIDAYGKADIQMRESWPVTGRVVDDQGNPLPGTTVRALRIVPSTEVANMDLAAGRYPRFVGNCVDLAAAGFPIATKVDANGDFKLDQLPYNSGLVLQISNSDFYNEVVYTMANTRHAKEIFTPSKPTNTGYVVPSPMARARRLDRDPDQPPRATIGLRESIQVSPIEIAMQPAIRLRINVVDDDTGQPVAGAKLPNGPVFQYPPDGRANADGMFEYTGLTPGELSFQVEPPDGTELLGERVTVRLNEDTQNAEAEVRLARGAVVAGQVVDDRTGRGVAGVRVNQTMTDKEGRFRLVTRPGPTKLRLGGRVEGYRIGSDRTNGASPNVQMVEAKVGQPATNVEFRLRQQDLLFYGRTLDPNGNPIGGVRISGRKNVRYVGGGESYTAIDQTSDENGMYVLPGLFSSDSKRVVDVPIIFRDASKSLAVRFKFSPPNDEEKTVERDVRLLPAGIVTGRVLNSETKEPLAGVAISVTRWNGTSGQYDGGTKTDNEGRFEFRSLVPGCEYSVGFRKESFVAAGDGRSYSQHFTAGSDETHFVADFEMTPKTVIESMIEVAKIETPSTEGMPGPQALQTLLEQFEKDETRYRERIDVAKNESERRQVIAALEPNPIYASAMMKLADTFPDTDVELKALIWVCKARVIAGSDSRAYRKQKAEAAKRLLEDYSDRQEIVDCLATLVYRSESPQVTAKKLASDSPHREVRGRACLLVAEVYERDLNMALRIGRQPSERDRQLAINYYQQVVDQYADLSDWRHETIGKRAESALRELRTLWMGQRAPEIIGQDLEGKPLKLSDFRGKTVILAFTLQVDWWSLLARDIRAAEYDTDKVVVLGVYSGDDREAALASARDRQIPWKTWFDGPDENPDSITRQWNNTTWPSYYVIDKDGIIRRKNMDRNGIPAAIEELWSP